MAMHPGVAEIVVLVDEHSLLFGQHDDTVCELHDGTPVDIDTVRRLCCEAMLRAVVVTADGTIPLNVGRAQRTATREQRRATRDPPHLRHRRLHHTVRLVRDPPHLVLGTRRAHRPRQPRALVSPPPPPRPRRRLAPARSTHATAP
ncbi:MAG: hypothetical protein WKF58_05740 [Ilumatobacteraceae bacterium]